jgi:hypothetical protein
VKIDFHSLAFFRNSLWVRKFSIFEQIDRNLAIKMTKMAILTPKWSFERSLLNQEFDMSKSLSQNSAIPSSMFSKWKTAGLQAQLMIAKKSEEL